MKVIHARNVNTALPQALSYLLEQGIPEPSRNGPVLVSPQPVTTVYERPWERVLFSPVRDANPFFHLFESLWMLAGRNDLEFPRLFNSRFGAYSDDGETVRGAYGHRWREWFGYDQLAVIIKELRENPSSRRCVLAMWDGGEYAYDTMEIPARGELEGPPGDLLATGSKDVPCNTHIYFRVRQDKHHGSTTQISDTPALDMTVCCRSNDILWGAYGANAVHMSFLQEYMAAAIGVKMGRYYQISNNFHLYTDVLSIKRARAMQADCTTTNHYVRLHGLVPLVSAPVDHCNPGSWHYDLNTFFRSITLHETEFDPVLPLHDIFFTGVAVPMYEAWMARKNKTGDGLRFASKILADDWRTACTQWIIQREASKAVVNG